MIRARLQRAHGRRGRLAPAAVLALVVFGLTGCGSGPATGAPATDRPVPDDGGARVYVAGQDAGTVTVVDAERHEILETVDLRALGYGTNPKPHHIAVEADGSHWYVSLIGANRVLKLDRSNRVVAEAAFDVPGMLELDPRSDRLYVGRSMSAVNPPSTIGVIDRDDMTVEEVGVFFARPHAIAAHPDQPLVYSASLAQNSMAVVEPAEEDARVLALPPVQGGTGVHTLVQWAISPDGRWLVGTGEMSARLLVFDLSDPAEPRIHAQIPVDARPWHPVFSPDGSEVWFANKATNTVTVVHAGAWTIRSELTSDAFAEPHGLAITPDGRWVYVSGNNLRGDYAGEGGTLTVIDRETRRAVKVLEVGANATGVGTNARR